MPLAQSLKRKEKRRAEKQLKLGVAASFLDEEITRLVQLSTKIPNNYEPVLAHFGPHISPLLPPNELSHQPPGPNVQDSAIMSVCQDDAVASDRTSVCHEQDIANESQDPDILHDEDNTKIPQESNDQYPSSDSSYCGSISECEEDTELESTSAPATSSINIVQNGDSYFSSNRDDSRIQLGSDKPPLTSKLGEWAANHNICPNALDKLLKILIDYNNPDLPRCSKTVLKTPRSTRELITEVAGGQHCYFGISDGISTRIPTNFAPNGQSVEVDVFIDGISPYKSAKLHLWVIAGCLTNAKTPPFVISIWCGKIHEPDNVTEFFEDFIQEANLLKTEGFKYNGSTHPFKIRNYIADAPARAMIKCVKKHNSYHGCERCNLKGEWLGRLTYGPTDEGLLRTDESLLAQDDPHHHDGVSPLLTLDTKLKTQCPLEPMHLLFLGVTRRIYAHLLTKKKSRSKLRIPLVLELSAYLVSLAPYFPSEFARKPRSLFEWKLFKATEFRRLLFYDGFLLFKSMKNKGLWEIHCLLSCACRILCDTNLLKEYWTDAEQLLRKFVKKSCKLFGQTFNVFNVHSLTHLAAECALHGALDDFSAWKYESYLGQLKKLLHAPGRSLQQIVCRLKERIAILGEREQVSAVPILEQPHSRGPILGLGEQYHKLKMSNMTLRISVNDACVITNNNSVVVVRNIVKTSCGIELVGNEFQHEASYFSYPFPSEILGIKKVQKLGDLKRWLLSEIKQKAVLLPLNNPAPRNPSHHWMDSIECLCLPMLHYSENQSVV